MKRPLRNKMLFKGLIVVAALLLLGFIWFDRSNNNRLDQASNVDGGAKTTSTEPSAQEDFSEGEQREPGNTLRENQGSGFVSDTGGNINFDTGNGMASESGEIVVFSPAKDSSVKSGFAVYGTSALSKVSLRLVDSISGVIFTGELKVIDGKFSGNITFNTNAPEGRLDVFGTKSDGSEFSNLGISLRFN